MSYLDEIRARWAKATPGPLIVEPDDSLAPTKPVYRLISPKKREEWLKYETDARVPYLATVYNQNDAHFFALAAAHISYLLTLVDRLCGGVVLGGAAHPRGRLRKQWRTELLAAAQEKEQWVLQHKEKYIEAWVAEHGLPPSEAQMVISEEWGEDGKLVTTVKIERRNNAP